MARLTSNHTKLYFDTLCRTQKGESVLSLIHATYQAKKNTVDDVKEDIAKRLENAYNLFKKESGTYRGEMGQFESQYTIGHELAIWKNSKLDLTDLAISVAENYITIRDYFDIVFLNYIQPVNNNIVHVLYHLLKYMNVNGKVSITKDEMGIVYMEAGKSTEKGEVNGAYNMLLSSSYFKADSSGKELIYIGKCSISQLIKRCDTTYVEKGYDSAKVELATENEYIEYLLHDYRPKENIGDEDIIDDECIAGGENRLFYGVPGAGKSYAIKNYVNDSKGCIERVVFHPDYTYSDFVGQIMPQLDENDHMAYKFVPGPFTSILIAAKADKNNMHYLIIEEVNRGNAPAIFGEIFQLLDRDEIGNSEYGITSYEIARAVFKDQNHKIILPSNVTLLATMNTSDQNVFTLDTAFQRRWNMKMIENRVDKAVHHDKKIVGSEVSWEAFALSINELVVDISVEMASSEDKRLGAYFIKEKELSANSFSEKVLKYLWDDAFKMEKDAIFKKEYKSLDEIINTYEITTGDKLAAVLRADVYNKMISRMIDDKNSEPQNLANEEGE